MPDLSIAIPVTLALLGLARMAIRYDRSVSRLLFSVVAVFGKDPRAKRASRLLALYLEADKPAAGENPLSSRESSATLSTEDRASL